MGNPSNSAIQTPPNSSPPAPVAAKVPEKAPLLKTAKPIAVAKKSENKPKQAEKKIELKPQASEKKVQATKFEGEFLKLDDEDIEDHPESKAANGLFQTALQGVKPEQAPEPTA